MTNEPINTPAPKVISLVTGHYREGRGYRTWREKGTQDWLLIATLEGKGRFGCPGGEMISEPGDLVLLRPGTPHDYGTTPSVSHWDLLWTHFHPRSAWHDWLIWPEIAPGLMRLSLREPIIRQKIGTRFLDVHRLATGALRQRDTFAMNALEEVLLWCDTQNPRTEQALLDPRIWETMDYLCGHLSEKISLEALAERSGLSVSRLAHLFHAQVGMTTQRFLERQRLDRAKQLLELTPRAIQAIAGDVGFDNPFYFSVRFKRETGLSPRAYRKQRIEESSGTS